MSKILPAISSLGSMKMPTGKQNVNVGTHARGTSLARVRVPRGKLENPDQRPDSGLTRRHLGTKSMSLVKLRKVGKETSARDAFYGD